MHPLLIALAAAQHAHQQGFVNGPMNMRWFMTGIVIAVIAAVLITLFGGKSSNTA
jgi:uncharacterized YccA/Bax inhibitor family protein